MLAIAVLGPVEVSRDDQPVRLPTGRTTELLVRLAVVPGVPVSVDTLIEDLWGDEAFDTARNTLQSKVSQLRRALGGADVLVNAPLGYVLDIDPDVVDAGRAVELAAAVTARRGDGDLAGALVEANAGLALFRGPVLPAAGDTLWVVPHRARFEEVRLGLLEASLATRAELHPGGELVGELELAVAEHPHREALWAALITALYRAGRQADALAAVQRVRRQLADELGLDPGPELRALEQRVLAQDLGPPPVQAARPRPGNVPVFGSSTIGRARETAEVVDLLAAERLVTIVGTAGVGKTRLAIDVARRVGTGDGPWLARLDTIEADGPIEQHVADVVGVPWRPGVLVERLAGSDALVVLDNCEHVVDQAARLAVELLDGTADVRVLATSQRPLRVDGEAVYELQPLAAADAVSLFAARAAARRAVDDEQVAAVCRAVDNLPLAIELAAARTRSLSVGEIAKRLDDRFALLTDPTGRRPSRRGALREAIAWSYDLLFPDDQRGLWALSCFAGGAPLDAAERVIAALDVPAPASLDVFDRLVDRSLTTTELDAIGAVRYGLLDSIRSYAEERLDEAGARAGAQGAHARWVADLAARADGEARGAGQPWCVRTARQERANVDLALDWTAVQQPELGLDIAIGFGWTWVVIGEGAAGAARIRRALVAVAEPDAVRAATANLCAAWLEASAGDLMAAFDDLERAAVLIEILGDQRLEADLDRHRAFVSMQAGRPHDALAAARRSRGAADRLHDEWMAAGAANLVAFASMTLGDQGAARQAAGDALRRREALGDTWGQMHAVAMLGRIAIAEGHLAEAEASLRRAAETSAELGFVGQTALHLSNLGEVQQAAGDHDLALVTLAQALDEAVAGSDRRLAATIRLRRAQSLHALGWDDEAAGELRTNLDWYARAGGGDGERASAALLAELQAGPADVDRL